MTTLVLINFNFGVVNLSWLDEC